MAEADPFRPISGPLATNALVRDRVVEAVLGQSGISHPALVAEIRRRFASTDVAEGALVREPVIEGAAPFVPSGRTLADCEGTLLHPDVIRALASESAGDYRFPPDAQPYQHQIESWEHLTATDRRSVLVSSGTGSGKTECFLIPLLHDLASEAEKVGRLSGVRALALYPLNALIASQEERLRAWTAPFGGRVRFGLYNGLTPERLRAQDKPRPEQVADRVTLRDDPPPILVTNVTMLEYMTVRRVDRPLIEKSRGKLRWIILDEAHSYVGSAAAEIALLIRRALLAFGVSPDDVRFVATSATIGEGKDVTEDLRRFLHDLSGVSETNVKVVLGQRQKVALPPAAEMPALSESMLGKPEAVAANTAVQNFVREAEKRAVRLDEADALLRATGQPADSVLQTIAADNGGQDVPLLPLRIHTFMRAVPGLWTCLNPACSEKPEGWQFGAIATERVDTCPTCSSPVIEVVSCRECGEPYLECEERDNKIQARISPPTIDEFAALLDREGNAEDEDGGENDHILDPVHRAMATRPLGKGGVPTHVDPTTGRVFDQAEERTKRFAAHDPDHCDACGASKGASGPLLRPLRFGAPFLIGNAAPVLLDGVPRRLDHKLAYRPPAEGRQLLSFTDSRQGTARFAANLQTNAERGYVRGFLYHAVQGSMATVGHDDASVVGLRGEIATLESIPAASPQLAELISLKKAELASKLEPSTSGVAWSEMRDRLAQTPDVMHWMRRVWASRDDRYRDDPNAFAEFLLLREFNRRPRRGNTAETMGLARLRFEAIDRIKVAPAPICDHGKNLGDWQGLLYSIIDMVVRGNFAIRANWSDIHWLHSRQPLVTLLPPGEKSEATREVAWPMLGRAKRTPSNLVLIIEKALGLDRTEPEDRAAINEVLSEAWRQLQGLFHTPGAPGYALDFSKANIAPVTEAWRCPVTRRVLPTTALGLTPYGHREGLVTSNLAPQPIHFPTLPLTFPSNEGEVEQLRSWLALNPEVVSLREIGVWANLHDRVALLSPYLRAAEHSAQQPPARLRRFEDEFKKGEINILNCSTTMEMGVDIGSVSAVMMTNVPPALANYRQRVGRAGRRRQGFASSLTYTRDTPLDREAFRTPDKYLARLIGAPRVKLDSRRIVQRHVNALLLARWFAGERGEALKARAGEFFGCPAELGASQAADSPAASCLAWLSSPSTASALMKEVTTLTRGTVLAGDRTVFDAAGHALTEARDGFIGEWTSMQAQASTAPAEAKPGLGYQLKRLAHENLLKELSVRGVLPGHGFPTDVVPFVNSDKPGTDERDEGEDTSRRRRSFPTRNLDIAIRDYAPGAEVVVDGLVYRSAGITLNWLRPADDGDAREIQSLKVFWTCLECGAADCGHVAPDHCPSCHAEVPLNAQRRFLEPAGFTADMHEAPHADTDEVTYVEPEPEQIVARGALWQPCADPSQGRLRASSDGLVFYSSRGPSKQGYSVCLECGRAEPAGGTGSELPLRGHAPLRGTKRNADGLCPGNEKSFKILPSIALGHETITDVAELQPRGLESEGAAWAAVSALRESLARKLGIEPTELGMAVRPAASVLGDRTHSLFLFDRASGGAGFAPQAVSSYEDLLAEARDILDCNQPGCTNGCSACVLTSDLYRQQEIIDRKAALAWVKATRQALATIPAEDLAAPGARLSRSTEDDIAREVDAGAQVVTIWAGAELEIAALNESNFDRLARRIADRGARLELVVDPTWLGALDPAAKLGLRDAAKARCFELRLGAQPRLANGAHAIAAISGRGRLMWASRDNDAALLGSGWGQGSTAPVVRFEPGNLPLAAAVNLDTLLPASGTQFIEIRDDLDGTIAQFGSQLVAKLLPAIRAAGPAGTLTSIHYNDRYLQSPLVVRLVTECISALREALAGPDANIAVSVTTNRFKPNERQPFAPDHDWEWAEDRRRVLHALMEARSLELELSEVGADHARVMTLMFAEGSTVRIVFDQGMGPWRTPRYARFEFGDDADKQAQKLTAYSAIIETRNPTYIVVTK